ncbi:MAG: TylF/MycF/NovP-related O-methyltransferase [Ignavibacteria bacterium]
MIELPDFAKTYDYENYFYFTCDNQRIGKLVAHYELFKMTKDIEGSIVECGVFKGASFLRFAMYRKLFDENSKRKIIGFDSFAAFPQTNYEPDIKMRIDFVEECGEQSISTSQLMELLEKKDCAESIELVAGDITNTIPGYVEKNPDLKISMLNLDADVYEPSVTVLEYLYPRIVPGGILILDDYGVFPGETKAVDDYFKDKNVDIRKFSYSMTPSYLIKN